MKRLLFLVTLNLFQGLYGKRDVRVDAWMLKRVQHDGGGAF